MSWIARPASLGIAACLPALGLESSYARPAWGQEAAQVAVEVALIPVSRSFRLFGTVQKPKTCELEDLRAAPIITLAVYFNTDAGPVDATFKGVLLWTLLQQAGIRTDPRVKKDLLRRTVLVTGADGYQVALSAGEIVPTFGGGSAIVAYSQDGRLLGPNGGFARLIVPGDKAGGRNVPSIAAIEVR